MDASDLCTRLLGIHYPWRVTDVQATSVNSGIGLWVAYEASTAECVRCGREAPVIKSANEEKWIGPSSNPVIIYVSMPRGTCDECGEFRVEAAWQSNCEPEKPEKCDAQLLARHLEVFVPKPGSRDQEKYLLEILDDLLGMSEVKMQPRQPYELAICPERARILLETYDHWENIICGYSTYVTDGAFLDGTMYPRVSGACSKEQTLVIKFILTNYRTSVAVDRRPFARFLGLEGMLLREAQRGVDADRLTELLCAELHYSDICDFVVKRIAHSVLEDETEVWSQEWMTVLTRWKLAHRRDPIAESRKDKVGRFEPNHRVLCVADYCAPAPPPDTPGGE